MQLPPIYKLWNEGEALKDHHGRDVYLVGIEAYAKEIDEANPYEFANEFICGQLATAIRLPVAHGIFIERNKKVCYASFNSFMSGGELPWCIEPVAREFISAIPVLAAGILVFDVWVNNKDRHPKNLGFDRDLNTVHIFDHGEALIRTQTAIPYLTRECESIELTEHCLARFMDCNSMLLTGDWIDRIQNIPTEYIESVVREAVRFNLTAPEAECVIAFLLNRRTKLQDLLIKGRNFFPKAAHLGLPEEKESA